VSAHGYYRGCGHRSRVRETERRCKFPINGVALPDPAIQTFGEKLKGYKQEIEGKILRKPELEEASHLHRRISGQPNLIPWLQEGHERITGEYYRKKRDDDDKKNPFATAKDDTSENSAVSELHKGRDSGHHDSDKHDKERAGTIQAEGTDKGHQEAREGHGLEREGGKII
jgi:hypothetical protein